MANNFKLCLLGLILILQGLYSEVHGASVPKGDKQSIFDILSQEEVLHISIRTDLTNFLANRNTDDEQKALVEFASPQEYPSIWSVDISVRGKHRRKTCAFPPVKLKFDKDALKDANLKKYKSLKLVTHCDDRAEAQELLLKEYLVYKMYNILTPNSFRVQLVRVDWRDSSGKHNYGEKWGFIIEHKDELVKRLESKHHNDTGVFHHQLNRANAALAYMFQYMIGNHDWDLESGRNLTLIEEQATMDILAVPYDFDFSLLVDAYYVALDWPLSGDNRRVYLGNFSDEENASTIALFKEKKKEFIKLIKSFKHLSRDTRFEMSRYIKSYYASLGSPLQRLEDFE